MNISWGKLTILTRPYKSGAYSSSDTWTTLSIPVEGSTSIDITEGDTKEAKQEGGDLVDSVTGSNVYELVFRLFVKKTDLAAYPAELTPVNGVITGEHAFKVLPEDPDCYGVEIPRTSVRCVEQLSSDEGITLEYHAKAILDNATGAGHHNDGRLVRIAKLAADGGTVNISANVLDFTASADSNGQAVIIDCPNDYTVTDSETWITATETSNGVLVTVTANTGDARTGTVTVTDDVTGDTAVITVNQTAA